MLPIYSIAVTCCNMIYGSLRRASSKLCCREVFSPTSSKSALKPVVHWADAKLHLGKLSGFTFQVSLPKCDRSYCMVLHWTLLLLKGLWLSDRYFTPTTQVHPAFPPHIFVVTACACNFLRKDWLTKTSDRCHEGKLVRSETKVRFNVLGPKSMEVQLQEGQSFGKVVKAGAEGCGKNSKLENTGSMEWTWEAGGTTQRRETFKHQEASIYMV